MTAAKHEALVALRREHVSLAVVRDNKVEVFRQHGIKDLLTLLTERPEALRGATVADKVTGKGAAALIALGGAAGLYAEVISRPALELLDKSGIDTDFGLCVPNIINRAGAGICPVEQLCEPCATAADCLPLIREFITRQIP